MAFANDRKKVDLRRLEKPSTINLTHPPAEGQPHEMLDILTKPIDFRPADGGTKPPRKNLEETILIDQINSSKITQLKLLEDEKKSWLEKDPHEGVLMELCGCDNCLKYRESVIHFYVEECEYNILWIRLQQIIERHYELIDDNPACVKKYRELMCPTRTKWLSDGQADNKKNIQISLASNLPLNNDMTLILIFNMLHSRDPHQLFELLCMQVKAISIAYFENFKDMCQPKTDGRGQEILGDINTFVSHGANEIQVGALKLEPLMAEYLKQFQLSWVFVCEHIFHRWVTTEVISLARINPTEIPSFPFFSIDFVESVLEWPRHWKLLERFYASAAEVARRKRIFEGQRLLRKVKGTPHLDKSELLLDEEPTKENDWRGILIHIRTLWQESARSQEMDPQQNRCRTCDNQIQLLRHAWDCDCRICAVTGGLFPFLGGWEFQQNLTDCTRCYRALQLASGGRAVEKRDFVYHLSWALFQHLPGRLEYIVKELQLPHICVWTSCSRVECLVAQSIVLGHYPKELALYLVKEYRPVDENVRFLVQPQTSVKNIFVTLNEEKQLNTGTLLALLAEVNVQRSLPDKQVFGELLQKYLKASGKDVLLDLSAYPESDRSDFMGNGASFPEDLVDAICAAVNPVHERGVNDFQMLLRAKNVTKSTVAVIDEMIQRYMAFVHYCRYFVENDFVTDCRVGGDAHGHHHEHRKGRSGSTAGGGGGGGAKKKNNKGDHAHGHGHSHSHHHHHHGEDQHSECCSLFGHGGAGVEWQRSRSNETRERLRKKLQLFAAQQMGAKDAAKARTIQRKTIDKNHHEGHHNHHHKGFYKTLENVLMKIPQMNLPHRSRQLPELDQLNLKEMLERAGGDFPRDPYSPPATPATPDSIAEELLRVQCKVEELQERIGNISLDAMVDYIEGNRNSKPKAQGGSGGGGSYSGSVDGNVEMEKKLAKKLRQKLKKHEQRRLEMLEELKGIYHQQLGAQAELKGQLKDLRAVKKRDKKRITDVEGDMKKAAKVASKTESMICEIICDLRETNPEFKFNYQPPPPQTQAVENGKAKGKEKEKEKVAPVAAAQKLPPGVNVSPMIPSAMNFMSGVGGGPASGGNDKAFQQFVAMQRQGLPQFKAPQPMAPQPAGSVEDDPAKRMVTIRRVNLPHAEAQVTVMAKGDAPGQDRLLYSFINGQMVPASPVVVQNVAGPPVERNLEKEKKQETKKKAQPVKVEKVVKTKTELKKEKKAQKLKEAEAKKEREERELEQERLKLAAVEKKRKKREGNDPKGAKVEEKRGTKETVAVVRPKKLRKEPRVEYLDPSFNKNKFNLLSMNDDEEDVGYSESEEEVSEGEEEEVVQTSSKKTAPVADPPINSNKGQATKPGNKKQEEAANKKKQAPVPTPSAEVSKPLPVAPAPTENLASVQSGNLSKKERRKMAKQNQQPLQSSLPEKGTEVANEDPVERAVKRAEKMAESLTTEMNKLNLNADTTIELINPFMRPLPNPFLTGNGEQLTEQLNRGVNVGGLQLPPGITLTKLDPARAKEIQRKKEAISQLSQPLGKQQQQRDNHQPPEVIMANPSKVNGGVGVYGEGANNSQVVVIETPELSKKEAEGKAKNVSNKKGKNKNQPQNLDPRNQPMKPTATLENGNGKKSGKNKENQRQQIQQKILASRNRQEQQQQQKQRGANGRKGSGNNNNSNTQNGSQMVTLRNPMFHNPAAVAAPAVGGGQVGGSPVASGSPIAQQNSAAAIRLRSSTGQVMDTPAAIIQNENGMFTIRNPALHQAYTSSGMMGGGATAAAAPGGPLGSMYHTDTSTPPPAVQTIPIDVAASQAWKVPAVNGNNTTKAIGSEMKQMKRQEAWQSNMQYSGMNYHGQGATEQQPQPRSYSPFDSQLNLGASYGMNGHGGGGGGGGGGQVRPSQSTVTAPPPGYLAKAGFSAFVASDHGCGHNGGDPNHQCEDPHPSALVGDQKYFREPPLMNMMNQGPYSDFIQHLAPGQRLNSEVTIHNINESKFLGSPQQQVPISNHVEITRIPADKGKHCDKLAVGSERKKEATTSNMANGGLHHHHHNNHQQQALGLGMPSHRNMESVFEPNQRINLHELFPSMATANSAWEQ